MINMNCNSQVPRYLCFTNSVKENQIRSALSLGIVNPIIRRHSDCSEVDFRFSGDPKLSGIPDILGANEISAVEENFSFLSAEEILSNATVLIRDERFWECHNYLEELWKRNSGQRKKLLHDVIGIVVSQIKMQMGQRDVGKRIYERSHNALSQMNAQAIIKQLPKDFTYPLKISLETILPMLED